MSDIDPKDLPTLSAFCANAVIVTLRLGCIASFKPVHVEQLVTALGGESQRESSATMMQRSRVEKDLLNSRELDAIRRKHRQAYQFIEDKCVKSKIHGKLNFFHIDGFDIIDSGLHAVKAETEALVEIFKQAYPSLVLRAAFELKSLFNPADYVPLAEVSSRFRFDVSYLKVGSSSTIPTANQLETVAEMAGILRLGLTTPLAHAVERLSGTDKAGKPKVFHDTLVKNIVDYVETFKTRNITDDKELAKLVEETRQIAAQIKSADQLREDGNFRGLIAEKFENILAQAKQLDLKPGSRMIDVLEDDDCDLCEEDELIPA